MKLRSISQQLAALTRPNETSFPYSPPRGWSRETDVFNAYAAMVYGEALRRAR